MQRGLDKMARHPWVQDPRRTGMITAFTLAPASTDNIEENYLDDAGWRFSAEARKRGALIRPLGNVVYFVLPLTITEDQIDELFDIAHHSLTAIF
jgi:adenosylmethionine-8-amino-7-oxononanoate aminotransferase